MSPHESDEALQRLLDRTLRELPPRRAPASLEALFLNELERRAALPWWRRSFMHWPAPARIAFLVISGALVTVVFVGGAAAVASLHTLRESGAPSFAWVHQIAAGTACWVRSAARRGSASEGSTMAVAPVAEQVTRYA